jgi:hypothetical protein
VRVIESAGSRLGPSAFLLALVSIFLASIAAGPLALSEESPAASTDSAVAADALPRPGEVLALAEAAMADAGVIKAEMKLEVSYPTKYTSVISLYANAAGDERAKIKTTMRSDTVRSLEVITGGMLYVEQATPVGIVVSKIDLNEVKKRLAAAKESFTPVPALGANALFELGALSAIVDFSDIKVHEAGDRSLYVISGKLSSKFADGGAKLPPGAARFYKSARVSVEKDTFLPASIELGDEGGKPILVLTFTSIEKGVEAPEGTFSYTVPPEADVIDRTAWAIAELGGK